MLIRHCSTCGTFTVHESETCLQHNQPRDDETRQMLRHFRSSEGTDLSTIHQPRTRYGEEICT